MRLGDGRPDSCRHAPGAGKPAIAAAIGLVVALLAPATAGAAAGDHRWSARFGAEGFDRPASMAIDSLGNVVVTGYFNGSVRIGDAMLTSAGADDVFVASFSSEGTPLWARRYGDSGVDEGLSVAVDAERNIVVVGSFVRSIDFGGGQLTSAGRSDMFVLKLSPNGGHLWSKRMGASGHDEARAVAIDSGGALAVTGLFEGSVDFGGGMLASAGSADAFLAKYSSTGTHLWSRRLGGVDFDAGNAVAIGSNGDPAVAGVFRGAADLGGGVLASAGLGDIFLASYRASGGAHSWSSRFGGSGLDEALTLAASSSGALTVGGSFEGSVDFGGGTRQSAGFDDGFIARYSDSGSHQWSTRIGGTGVDVVTEVALDQANEVAVTGSFEGGAAFGGSTLNSAGDSDAFVMKAGSNGSHQWSRRYGGSAGDEGSSVAFDQLSGVLATGWFRGTTSLGGPELTSAGFEDVYLLALKGADPAVRIGESGGNTRVAERGVTDTYTLVLAAPPTATVSITMTDPAGQVTLAPASVTFSRFNWFAPKTVTVHPVDDDLDEGTHTATVSHQVVSSDPRYSGIAAPSLTVVVLDNDEEIPPQSSFTTPDGSVMLDLLILPAERIRGTSTDERSGILSVSLTFTSAAGEVTSTQASLQCAGGALRCDWNAPFPSAPGLYEVRARATDQSENLERPGPTITIVVV